MVYKPDWQIFRNKCHYFVYMLVKDKYTAFVCWRRNEHPFEKDISKVVYNCTDIKRNVFFNKIIYKVLFYSCFSGSLKIRIGIFIYCCFLYIVFIRSKNELFFFSCTQDARKIHTCIIYRNDWLHVFKTWPMSHCTWCIL